MNASVESSKVCPQCQRTVFEQAAGGGLCLNCAGLRALDFGTRLPESGSSSQKSDIIGPYEVIEELGQGGMGRVLAACQPGLGRIVAVKTIRAGVDPELDLRFQREIRTLSGLRHPNIVAIHDSGRSQDSLYFSMDYVEDGDLAGRIRAGSLPWKKAVPLLRKVAHALAYLHAQGVLHRDLKPSNILLDGDEPKIADFGLATEFSRDLGLTVFTRVLGTPHYLAPEALLKGSPAYTVASDLYSFGVVLYETLTGRTPFAGASPEGLLRLLQTSDPRPLRDLVPSIPRDLETICLKCLERDPARRYASATALEEDLVRFEENRPILARPLSPFGHLLRWTCRRPELAALWVLVFSAALGATFAALLVSREQERTAAALTVANDANTLARERLRSARLNEARAVVLAPTPGRRARALAAVAEAAQIRVDADLRSVALAALTTSDLEPTGTWDLQIAEPARAEFSSDGQVAAIRRRNDSVDGLDNSQVLLRSRQQAEPLGEIHTSSAITRLALNADGSLLALILDDASLRLWSTQPLRELSRIERGSSDPRAPRIAPQDFSFDPFSRRLVVTWTDGRVDLFEPSATMPSQSYHSAQTSDTVSFSPDGRWIALARLKSPGSSRVTVLDAGSLRVAGTLEAPAPAEFLTWAPDGRMLGVLSTGNLLTSFAIPLLRPVQRIDLAFRDTRGVLTLGPSDDLLLIPEGFGLRLLDGWDGSVELSATGFGASSPSLVGNHDEFLTTSITNVVTRWRFVPSLGWRVLPPSLSEASGKGMGPWTLDLSPDHRWLVVADGPNLLVRDTAWERTAALVTVDPLNKLLFSNVAFSSDGTHLWRCSTLSGLSLFAFAAADDGGSATLSFERTIDNTQGSMISSVTSDRCTLALVNAEAGKICVLRVSANGATIESQHEWSVAGAYSAALSPDGSQVLVNCSGTSPTAGKLCVYRCADGSIVRELPAQARGEAVWCADGHVAMTSNGPASSTVWNTADWSIRCTLGEGLGGDGTTFTLSADGKMALVFADNKIQLVSTSDGQLITRLEFRNANGFCLCIKQTGTDQFAVAQLDGRVDLLDIAAWRQALAPLGLGW